MMHRIQSVKKAATACVAAMFFMGVLPAGAEPMHFTASLTDHNDVGLFSFTLAEDAEDIYLWTDSFQGGLNFDPLLGLWENNGDLLAWNDDNPGISPGTQTDGDAGMYIPMLWAGDYIVTFTANGNAPIGMNLSDGFFYDGSTPEPLATGGAWSVWISVGSSPPTIPEPSLLVMWGVGLLGVLGVITLRSRAKQA